MRPGQDNTSLNGWGDLTIGPSLSDLFPFDADKSFAEPDNLSIGFEDSSIQTINPSWLETTTSTFDPSVTNAFDMSLPGILSDIELPKEVSTLGTELEDTQTSTPSAMSHQSTDESTPSTVSDTSAQTRLRPIERAVSRFVCKITDCQARFVERRQLEYVVFPLDSNRHMSRKD